MDRCPTSFQSSSHDGDMSSLKGFCVLLLLSPPSIDQMRRHECFETLDDKKIFRQIVHQVFVLDYVRIQDLTYSHEVKSFAFITGRTLDRQDMHSNRIITLLGLNIMSEAVIEAPWEKYEGRRARVDIACISF
jgi:hypothetical protein